MGLISIHKIVDGIPVIRDVEVDQTRENDGLIGSSTEFLSFVVGIPKESRSSKKR